MVSEDHGRHGLSAVLLTALLGCGCLQTQTGGTLFKPTAATVRSGGTAAEEGSVALAVAKPARGMASDADAAARPDGPALNDVQPAGATADPPAEQAPHPHPHPLPNGPAQPPPAAGQLSKDKDAPIAPPGSAAAPKAPTAAHAGPDATLSKKPYLPGTVPPAPPGGVVQAGGFPPDPHQRPVPTASGALLNLPPGESPAERALELNARLQAADADRAVLEQRARELTVALETRDRALAAHSHDIHEAADEVARAREQVTAWRKELEEARGRLRSRERDDVETLKAIITLLERLNESGRAAETHQEGGAVRMPPEE